MKLNNDWLNVFASPLCLRREKSTWMSQGLNLLFPLHRCLFFSFLKYFRMFDFLKLKCYCRQFETVLRNSTRFPFSLFFHFPAFETTFSMMTTSLPLSLSLYLPLYLSPVSWVVQQVGAFVFEVELRMESCQHVSCWSHLREEEKISEFLPRFFGRKNLAGLKNTDVMNCFTLVE